MHPDISAFAMDRTYKSEMPNHPDCKNHKLDARFEKVLRQFLKADAKKKINVVCVDVKGSESTVDDKTASRENEAHRKSGTELFYRLIKADRAHTLHAIMVITPYKKNEYLWKKDLIELATLTGEKLSAMPTVVVGDSCQGDEADFVVWDPNIHAANSTGELGILQREELNNVVETRARRCMITFYNADILKGTLCADWDKTHSKNRKILDEPKPYLF